VATVARHRCCGIPSQHDGTVRELGFEAIERTMKIGKKVRVPVVAPTEALLLALEPGLEGLPDRAFPVSVSEVHEPVSVAEPQTSSATSTTWRSFATSSASVTGLPW
jgi:hypothetical protein